MSATDHTTGYKIDWKRDTLRTMTEASNMLPGRPHVATLWRWRQKGLATIKIGGVVYTSDEAIDFFIAQQNDEQSGQPSRKQQIADAKAELAAAGI